MAARIIFFRGADAANARIVGPSGEAFDESTGVNTRSMEAASSSGGGEFADTEIATGAPGVTVPESGLTDNQDNRGCALNVNDPFDEVSVTVTGGGVPPPDRSNKMLFGNTV